MTLSQLRSVARAIIPGCKSDVVSDTLLDLILNAGVKDITAYCECLPTNKTFNAVASQGTAILPYAISTVITDYLDMAGAGLWWNEGDGTTPKWKKLNPRTIEWLDENRPNWHEIGDGSPEDYAIDGDNLYITPAPDTALDDGFWMFYTKVPSSMVATSSYPFSGITTEFTQLSMFDFSIIYYARWKILPMLGKDFAQDEYNRNQNLYVKERAEKLSLYRRRPDIAQTALWQGPVIR